MFRDQREVEFERNVDLCDVIFDALRWTCIACKKLDQHGLPVFQFIGREKVVTGVICGECQNRQVFAQDFF